MRLRIYTYIVVNDAGFAPNPFHGCCTLACCKPAIRRTAAPGDWVVGITPARQGRRGLVYAMKVDESIPFEAYWLDRRFTKKRPARGSNRIVEKCGDNCYEPIKGARWRQLPCCHSRPDGTEDVRQKDHDLRGVNVLVSRHFSYFGAEPHPLPTELAFAIPRRFHRVKFSPEELAKLARFLESLPRARNRPDRWPEDDQTWKPSLRCV